MDITIDAATKEAILTYARQIAQYRGHANLVNGLQPAADLEAKYYHEWEELREAIATKTRLHQLHEAADLYYYACQLEAQTGQSFLASTLASIHNFSMDAVEVEAAALAKCGYRAERAGNKDEAHELQLIQEAIQTV